MEVKIQAASKWISKSSEHPSDGVPQTHGVLTLLERCLV